jgi:gluconate 2-dehydrogenase gamma chain
MAESSTGNGQPKSADRRNFLKIGAGVAVGVAAGAAVAAVAGISYNDSAMSSASSSSSSTVASLQSALSASQQQLNAAQGQVSSLNGQLSSTQAQLSSANAQLGTASSQLASTQQALTSANGQIATLNSQVTSLNSSVSSASAQAAALQVQIDTTTGFLTLSTTEQTLLAAIAETIIPSDSNGPGAKEAGAIYFIDRVLATDYGKNGNMYMQGPFVMSGLQGPVTVGTVSYSGGTPVQRVTAGTRYQYQMNIREFFRYGLAAFETYCNSAYGGNFENLSAASQLTALQDLWNNKPTSFANITPVDFAYELTMLVWCGFLMDPLYGGNINMVGWEYVGFNGVNNGNFYGEGYTPKQLMVSTTPIPLKPASLAQYQKGSA